MRSLTRAHLVGYGVGQVGGQIYRDMPAILLLYFMTNTLGIPGLMAGTAILIPKIWVVICDPLVGAWSDQAHTRWGRRRPFLFAGAILSSLALVALFAVPRFDDPLQSAAYITVMFTIASTAFSLYSVPYLTMATEMTGDYHERSRIMAYRLIFTAVGMIIGAGASQPLVTWLGTGREAYLIMAALFASVCLITMLATFFATLRIPLMEARSAPMSLAGQVRLVSRNRPFMVLAGIFLLLSLAQATGYSVLPFLFHYVVENDALLLPFIGILGVMTVISAPLWASVTRRIGKVRGFAISVIGWAVISVTWLWAGQGGEMRDALVLLRGFLVGLISPGSLVLGLSMLADCVDHERKTTGENREGVFAGVWSALEKLAFAGGPFISGAVLSLLGFVESTSGPVAQTERALTGVYVSLAWIPVAAAAISLLLLRRYPRYSEP